MMQRHTRAADFFYQRFAARLKFIQVRWAKRLVGRPRKDQICHFEVAHRPIVRRGQGIDLLCDPQRGFACLVIWPNVAHDRGINSVCKNDQGIISYLRSIFPRAKAPGITMNGSVAPIRKLNFLSVPTSARSSAIASRNSRLRSGAVVLSAYSSSACFKLLCIEAR